jgi:hypothetical protein
MTKYGAVESGDIADVYDLLVLFDMNWQWRWKKWRQKYS